MARGSDVSISDIRRLAAAGKNACEIAEEIGILSCRVYYHAKKHGIEVISKRQQVEESMEPTEDDPTPVEIAERAAAIRSTWTVSEERRRNSYTRHGDLIPTYKVGGLVGQRESRRR